MKPVLTFCLLMMLAGSSMFSTEPQSDLLVEVHTKPALDSLETHLSAVLVNQQTSPVNVVLPAGPFPFDVELIDKSGHDLLSKSRKPLATHRTETDATQVIHLAANGKMTFEQTLGQYLQSRGYPKSVEGAVLIRVYVAASVNAGTSFSVIRSNSVPLSSQ